MTSEERREYSRRWREAHREKLRAYHKRYYGEHREKWPEYKKRRREEINANWREWRAAHREEINAYQRVYHAAHREEANARQRKYVKEHRDKALKWHKAAMKRMEARLGEKYLQKYRREHPNYMREYNAKNKAYHKVRCITNSAIKSGKLVRLPCENCGEQQSEAHHIDYNKPLEVMWLCRRCHEEWHKKYTAIPPKDAENS